MSYSATAWPDIRGQEYARSLLTRSISSPLETAGDLSDAFAGTNTPYSYQLGWNSLTSAQAADLIAGAIIIGGVVGGLYFFEWKTDAHVVSTANGDGVTTTFTLPAKGCTVSSVSVNGVTTAVTLSPGTGANGEDRIVFAAAPAIGATIVASITGRRRRRVWLATPDAFSCASRKGGSRLFTARVTLIEVEAGS